MDYCSGVCGYSPNKIDKVHMRAIMMLPWSKQVCS